MNAQVAVALDRTSNRSPRFPAQRPPHVESFEVTVDAAVRSIWVTRRPDSNASVTRQQLLDTQFVDGAIDCELHHGNRFKVLASAQRNVFSLGGDLAYFVDCIAHQDRNGLSTYATLAIDAIANNLSGHGARNLSTIALIAGETQGGGFEAALSCHFLIAERGSHFGFPEPLFGMFPGMGGEPLLAARVGEAVASRIVRNSNRYPAEFLFDIGVIDYLVEPGAGTAFASRLLLRTQVEDSVEAQRLAQRKAQLRAVTRAELEKSVARWTEQAMTLSARQIRTMKYIIEMQSRRVA
ncbi:MAG: crotonase/enoyl-CoA hydratase family protein [Parvibaculaceae bacterium]